MFCDKCQKREAKVYYTEIINGEKKEQYLCEECASQCTSFQIGKDGMDVSLGSLLSSILSNYYGEKEAAPKKPEKALACQTCGITYEEVLKAGKLGCADCYRSFGKQLEKTLRQIQGADTHMGKAPASFLAKESLAKDGLGKENVSQESLPQEATPSRIERLSMQLQEAVQQEEFEEAARLRDEIRELKEAAKNA